MFQGIKGNHPHRIIKLAGYHIANDGFEVCLLNFSFSVNRAVCAKAIYNKIDRLIGAVGDEPGWTSYYLASTYPALMRLNRWRAGRFQTALANARPKGHRNQFVCRGLFCF
jgi:hypothetical protein